MRASIRIVVALAAPLLGCPSQTPSAAANKPQAQPVPEPGIEDPRVVEKDGELYTQKTADRIESKQREENPSALGSGRPDETNGVCRLYAPKLPNPECCVAETGFDEATVREACGHDIYLGESFRFSCGYYFHSDEGPRWFRLSRITEKDPKTAADNHDRKLADVIGDKYTGSSPVPGVPGAYWSRHDEYRWAFLPGWDDVRQLSWNDDSCSDEGVTKVIAQIVAAKRPPKGDPRPGLLPKARM